ncbi:hypothetical protein NQ314_016398 [Rhamnusium bicolor]|uniref:Uncharacterized protein n=1 Tax=Rhamnusium bicolor TaxID=1586634 RepID=A0AAV8WVX0_9CUCU|nr:hypothetical protein NQ314_016398 [Rhamnusium bicolor]
MDIIYIFINLQCLSVGNEIYNTEWYNLEVDIQKDLILVLMNCKKPVYLKAGSFGFLSYQMILSILKTSYSIVSLMKATSVNN